ncbi:MAG: hypothetical protein V4515_14800 [Chloroflexota bacterium]
MTAPMGQKAAPDKGAKQPLKALPFTAGVQPSEFQSYDEQKTLTASTQTMPTYTIEPTGFLENVYILVETQTSPNAGAANVTFAQNGPFNVLDNIELKDAGPVGSLIGGAQFNGWDLMIANKYGGYSHQDDPRSGPNFLATTGTSTAGGAFRFILRLPIELVKRDGVGALVNKSSSTTYKLYMRISDTATPYGTPPSAAHTVRIRVIPESYWDPDDTDRLLGRALTQLPPLSGTTQFWTKGETPLGSGAVAPMLSTGLGNLIRNYIFILVDSNLSRTQGESDFPDPFVLKFEANELINRLKRHWRQKILWAYGYGHTGAAEAVGGQDNGVFPAWFNDDFGLKPGAETRRRLLRTSPDSRLQVSATIGGSGAHTLYTLVNHVAPAGDPATLIV